MGRPLQNLVVTIGAMKAGTSWLYMMMKDHPSIDCPPVKEIHYFWSSHVDPSILTYEQRLSTIAYNLPRILGHTPQPTASELMQWFGRYVSEPVDDRWFTSLFAGKRKYAAEFSNLYGLLPPEAWRHMRRLCKHLHIIYILRNPIERLWSHTRFHAHLCGHLNDLSSWGTADYERFISEHRIAEHGRYARTLNVLNQNFDTDEYCILDFAEICERPHDLSKRLETFLGITHHSFSPERLFTVQNESPRLSAPRAFYEAAATVVETELEALDRMGFAIPVDWLLALDDAHLDPGLTRGGVAAKLAASGLN